MSIDSESSPLIAHIIYTLSTGGMENGLVNIINRMPAGKYRHVIICLTEADNFARRITADGVEIIELHMREGHDFDCYRRLQNISSSFALILFIAVISRHLRLSCLQWV